MKNREMPKSPRQYVLDARDESGTVTILVALSLVVLMGFVGLAIDVGGHYNHTRLEQTSADAGALQGAYEILRGNTSLITTAARNGTSENGHTDGSYAVNVAVHHPPVTGYYVGDGAAVEVVVSQPSTVTFMTMFGFGAPTIPERAVAWAGANSTKCVHILEDQDEAAFNPQSSHVINAPNCDLMVNSDDNYGGRLESNSLATFSNASFVGDYVEQSSSDLITTSGSNPFTSSIVAPDPMAWVSNYTPSTSGCDHVDWEIDQSSITLWPGVYCGKFTLKNSTVGTVMPGMYVMKGGPMKIEGDSVLQGSEVTFYFTEGGGYDFEPFSFSSNARADLSAPSVCTQPGTLLNGCSVGEEYFGVLFWSDPTAGSYDDEFRFESNTTHNITGAVYMPNHVFNPESSSIINSEYLILVVRQYIGESNSVVNIGTNFPSGISPLKRVALVE